LWVDRERARFSAWYELFPRSTSPRPGAHGTFADVERQLPEIAAMGFDILYMPPIHPIGRAFRKGPENSTISNPGDPGSPWAIGDRSVAPDPSDPDRLKEDDGGHKSIHPELGTYADFDHLVAATRAHGMEIALDIAFQCSPDHPWVTQHPTWFNIRPDGSIQYAENPPKKYQDIYRSISVARLARLWEGSTLIAVLDQARRPGIPRRQSSHQSLSFLGVVPTRSAQQIS
jgi:starch synthase (maltosyl-transferring)